MPRIIANLGVVTQINVFTAPEGGQGALIDFLKGAVQAASDGNKRLGNASPGLYEVVYTLEK